MMRALALAVVILGTVGFYGHGVLADDEDDATAAIAACSPYHESLTLFQENSNRTGELLNFIDVRTQTWAENPDNAGCISVQVRAESVWGSGAGERNLGDWDFPNATALFIAKIMNTGVYSADGHHYQHYGLWPFDIVRNLTNTHDTLVVTQVQKYFDNLDDVATYDTDECGEDPAACEEEVCPGGCTSPLVINIPGDGFKFTGLDDAVTFDINGDGIPDRVGWTSFQSQDVFLARDRNHNGRIDDGSELFGNHTPVALNGPGPLSSNGFEVLRYFESTLNGPSFIADNIVGVGDQGFSELLLWCDSNHDGISQPWELTNAVQAGLTGIKLDYHTTRRHDTNGNLLREIGNSTWNLNGHTAVRQIVDVWFVTDQQ